MRARNPEGEIVEVTKKTYSTLYRYKGWTLVKDEETDNGNGDLAKLKKAELQKLASDKGLDFKADDTKEDLINLLNA